MRTPFRGGIVVYSDPDGVLRFGVITHTYATVNRTAVRVEAIPPITGPDRCHLDVYVPGGYVAVFNVSPGDQPGHWTWPL